jgi:hypothetical protein
MHLALPDGLHEALLVPWHLPLHHDGDYGQSSDQPQLKTKCKVCLDVEKVSNGNHAKAARIVSIGGEQARAMSVTTSSSFFSYAVGPTTLTRTTQQQRGRCVQESGLEDMEETGYESCTKTCGSTGTKGKTRSVTQDIKHGGLTCPTLSASMPCSRFACPVDCKASRKKRNNDSQKAGKHTNERSRKTSPVGAVKLLAGVPCVALFFFKYIKCFIGKRMKRT